MQNLNRQFELLRITRQNVLSTVSGLTTGQLNHIPPGFNNNIAWNLIHLVVTQQLLCYKLAGLPVALPVETIDRFKKGTAPQEPITQEEVKQFSARLFTDVDQLAADYQAGLFQNYQEYQTSYNVTLGSIEDAIQFNNLHEALHLGSIMALKRNI